MTQPLMQLSPLVDSVFFTRYFYDYTVVRDSIMSRVWRRLQSSTSSKHGMLGIAMLFRANYEGSMMTPRLRNYATEHHLLAMKTLQLDLENDHLSPWVKLVSLTELTTYAVSHCLTHSEWLLTRRSIMLAIYPTIITILVKLLLSSGKLRGATTWIC